MEVQRVVGSDIKLIGSIKGDAYGHGVVEIGAALQRRNAYSLMTGRFEDVKRVREAGIDIPVAMFVGYTPEQIPTLLEYGAAPTIVDFRGAEVVSRSRCKHTRVYIKVDMGLGRIGIGMESAVQTILRISRMPNLNIECVYTHVPFYDAEGRDWAQERLLQFDRIIANLKAAGLDIPVTQARASSCIVAGLRDNCNAVCVGHLLYGLVPTSPSLAANISLRPVMRAVKTRLVHVRKHPAGSDIAIGKHFGIALAKLVGVVPLGTSDGMPIPGPDRPVNVLLHGQPIPIIGVSLEHTILDLRGVDKPEVGDEVVIIGRSGQESITLQDFAKAMGRSELEVLGGFADRMRRVYVA